MTNSNKKQYVSIIMPAFNDQDRIVNCLKLLSAQTYGREWYEIIVIDNKSTDETKSRVQEFDVVLLEENEIQSSYAARNKGIRAAKGDLIAFTDSDCIPEQDWVENLVLALGDDNADLAAGHIDFIFRNIQDPYEFFDSVYNMQQKQKVENRGEAVTANLIVKKSIFDEIGLFPYDVQSGGDATWTKKASSSGFKLTYAQHARISHPTRSKASLLKKQFRVGYGHIPSKLEKGSSRISLFWDIFRGLLIPPLMNLSIARRAVKHGGLTMLVKTYYVMWVAKIYTKIGSLSYLRDRWIKGSPQGN